MSRNDVIKLIKNCPQWQLSNCNNDRVLLQSLEIMIDLNITPNIFSATLKIEIINLTLATEAEKKNEVVYKNDSRESLKSCAYELSYLWMSCRTYG